MNDCTYNSQFFELNEEANTTSKQISPPISGEAVESSKSPNDSSLDTQNLEQLWSIDDDTLFHPLGLKSHGHSAVKCVFVTWSEDYLLNFVFKTSTKTKRTSLTKVRLAVEADDQICDMLILELNTLLLMQSGRIYYFSSVKTMHPMNELSGVRCISAAAVGFSVIRLLPGYTLSLEVYRDVVNLGKCASTLQQHYDITFDEQNLFNCSWQDERFTLHSLEVTADNLDFLQEVVGKDCALSSGQEVHFFTVSGHVFALIPACNAIQDDCTSPTSPDYHIQLLCTYATDVSFIQVNCQRQLCLIFLECGSIDIWHMSRLRHGLHRRTHHTGTQYTHCEFNLANECFYYTDEQQVAQLQFHYESSKDDVQVLETFKAIPGIVALTWAASLDQLVCLSCNNIFYRLPFKQHKRGKPLNPSESDAQKFESLQQLYELTPARLKQLLQKGQLVKELTQVPKQLHQAIEEEFVKQQLLAVSHQTRIYRKLCEASLEYSLQMPSTSAPNAVLLYTQAQLTLNNRTVFALLRLSIQHNYIFQTALWQLHIQYGVVAHTMYIPADLLHTQLTVVIPLKYHSHTLLPHFQLRLLTFVAGCQELRDFVAISLPVGYKVTTNTYARLFSRSSRSLGMAAPLNLTSLVAQFHKSRVQGKPIPAKETSEKCSSSSIKCSLILAKTCTFETVLKMFGIFEPTSTSCRLNFAASEVGITYDEARHSITLDCSDAAAIYYTKLQLQLKLRKELSDDVQEVEKYNKAMLLQYQCDIERCYGTLLTASEDNLGSDALHLANLKRIHTKLRTDGFHMLS